MAIERVKRKPWPDVPRLLRLRQRVSTTLDEGVASSVTAFLAWKAFLITAKSVGLGAERDRCTERIVAALEREERCRQEAARFTRSLGLLREGSNTTIAEWFVPDDDDVERRDRIVARFRREVAKYAAEPVAAVSSPAGRHFVADYAFAFRNAVIAHGSVHSSANMFQALVPSYDALICAVACQGYAERLNVSFEEAEHECTDQVA